MFKNLFILTFATVCLSTQSFAFSGANEKCNLYVKPIYMPEGKILPMGTEQLKILKSKGYSVVKTTRDANLELGTWVQCKGNIFTYTSQCETTMVMVDRVNFKRITPVLSSPAYGWGTYEVLLNEPIRQLPDCSAL
ncbi:MAG: hypothetical protein ACOYOK_05925 [Pseudobdellovibrionaceae bacterium]